MKEFDDNKKKNRDSTIKVLNIIISVFAGIFSISIILIIILNFAGYRNWNRLFYIPFFAFIPCFVCSLIRASLVRRRNFDRYEPTVEHNFTNEAIDKEIIKGDDKVRCVKCGAFNDENSRFCNNCGAKLTKTCPNCGKENTISSVYCSNCGEKLENGKN